MCGFHLLLDFSIWPYQQYLLKIPILQNTLSMLSDVFNWEIDPIHHSPNLNKIQCAQLFQHELLPAIFYESLWFDIMSCRLSLPEG